MRESDEFTINTSVSSRELMRRAAQGVCDSVSWYGRIAIVCGSGNNGGDGYALGEILADKGFSPVVLRTSEKFSDDGLYYYRQCVKKGVGDLLCDEFTDFSEYDIIVDCILGTGFSGTLREDMIGLIEQINRSGAYVVSVDGFRRILQDGNVLERRAESNKVAQERRYRYQASQKAVLPHNLGRAQPVYRLFERGSHRRQVLSGVRRR